MIERETIIVTHVPPELGCAFAVTPKGAGVYITAGTVRALRVEPGDEFEAVLVENLHRPERTPWFARHIVRCTGNQREINAFVREMILEEGGTWTPFDLAAEYEDSSAPDEETIGRAYAGAELLYLAGLARKVMLFDAANSGPAETWYLAAGQSVAVEVEE